MGRRIAWKYFGLIWLGVALLIRFVFQASPYLYQEAWHGLAFPMIKHLQAAIFGYLPLPGYFVMPILLVAWILWRFPRKWKERSSWLQFARRMANLLGGTVAAFLMLWGYNYLDAGIGARMDLERSNEAALLADAYLEVMQRAMDARGSIENIAELESVEQVESSITPQEIEGWVRAVLQPVGYPTGAPVHTRYIKPAGTLQGLSITGIYNPWTGEANIDDGLGPLKRIFTTAHEMAHAFGVTGEADANFTAYLACLHSDNALANYAAEYALWRALGREVNRSYSKDEVEALAAAIPEALRVDRDAIWHNAMQYPEYLPKTSAAMNDNYLKLQGVKAGIADYDAFVGLYFGLQAKTQTIPAD